MKSFVMATALLLASFSQASLLTFEQGTLELDNVNLSKSATVNDANGNPTALTMDLLGAGLRSKTVLFIPAKVYVIQLFSDNKPAFTRDANALTSLVNNSKMIALKITMLRTVDASSLAVSFKEALQANGHAIDSDLAAMLNIVEKGAPGTQGKELSMLMVKDQAGKVNFYYQDAAGKQQSLSGSSELGAKVMSIWLGKPADDGLAKTKEQLLKPVY